MSFARDRLYNGYLRRKMPTIVSKVKVREIIVHLPCLTDHDRENIEAKRETYGNYDGMILLLDCLKRRDNWPEEFIAALEACEHRTIAAEIRAEYDALRGAGASNPSSPPMTVVRASVHPAPSASHPSVPEVGGNSQAAVSPAAEASPPPEPATQPSPPPLISVQTQASQSPDVQVRVPEVVPPPEPVAEPSQDEVAPPPSTPPPSPATPHTQETATPPPQTDLSAHQEPEENSESDMQDFSAGDGAIPDQVNAAGKAEETLQPPVPAEESGTETPASPDPIKTTTATEVSPPRSPSPTQIHSDVTDSAPVSVATPEKPPVQDTTPPAAAVEPQVTSDPPVKQVVESSPQTDTAAPDPPLPAAAGTAASPCDDDDPCLSKPGELISVDPQNEESPTMRAPSPPVEQYSGSTGRLEYSAVTSTCTPEYSAVTSSLASTATAAPCQENGIPNNHNEPEENHYESPSQSLETQEVIEHMVEVSGEPSILNLDGQDSTPEAQIVNGEAAKEIKSVSPVSSDPADFIPSVKSPSTENSLPSESAAGDVSPKLETLQESEEKTASQKLPSNTKYIVAAGVGVCALLMAWKFKN